MKKIFAVLAVVFFALPGVVLAHASPVEYVPASSATVVEAPQEIIIRFSERVEPGASRIKVLDGEGNEFTTGTAVVDEEDAHILSVTTRAGEDGAYFVTWSVVSSDDGHFTKGGFTYFIGERSLAGTESVPQVEVVQLSALPEAITMAVELLGNSLLLGALVLFAFVLRPRMRELNDEGKRAVSRVHTSLVTLGVLLVLVGALSHVALKTSELASLHGISVSEALPLYLATVSGSATVIRAGVITLFGIVFFFRRSAIRAATRITLAEWMFVLLLGVFAYFRATVSHATANPFHPEIGIAVNFLHLIGKDLSTGLLAGLLALLTIKSLRPHVSALLTQGMRILAALLALTGATAAYIVWLHLKDLHNLSSTLWGERFVPLLVCASIAVVLLAYHVVGNRYRRGLVQRFLPYTLAAEFFAAAAIVFFSALMIITSPPLEGGHGKEYRAEHNGVVITLAKAPFEDDAILLTAKGKGVVGDPIVLLDADQDGGIEAQVEKRFEGGYALPLGLFTAKARTVSIIVPQEGGYDAHALFTVARDVLAPLGAEGRREFDWFAALMLLVGLASVALSFVLYRQATVDNFDGAEQATPFRLTVGLVVAFVAGSQLIGWTSSLMANGFKRECVADGNAWHLMLPSQGGRPVSSVPAEGCMALGGAFHIADAREYRFLKSPAPSKVEFSTDLTSLSAGVPTMLAFSIQNEDGTPARLSVQHERLVHVIIIGKDMTRFFHVHPDDAAPLSKKAIEDATFTVPFTFPASGEYLIGIDYASGLSSRSEQVVVTVGGTPVQSRDLARYPLRGTSEGYDITLSPGFPTAGTPATLLWRIQKDGQDVLDLAPYLAAAMHVAVVKDDFSEFIHAHGEVHLPGAPIVNVASTTAHNHAPPPPRFGPLIEAHTVFPSAGDYTVFAQFSHGGSVITVPFSLRVE